MNGSRLRESYVRYNAAYSRRAQTAADGELQRARLDLLLTLVQAGEPLPAELEAQTAADARHVLHSFGEEQLAS
jgi:hypothetical protein